MKYSPLFEIALEHPYHEGAICPDLDVVVSAETEVLLRRHRLLAKLRPGLIVVIAEVDPQGMPVIPFPPDAVLAFDLRVTDERAVTCMDATPIMAMRAPVYTNGAGPAPLAEGALALVDHGAPPSDRARAAPRAAREPRTNKARAARAKRAAPATPKLRPSSWRAPLARIEITGISAWVPSAAVKRFTLLLAAKSAHWAYYVVADLPGRKGGGVIGIVDTDPSPPAGGPVLFGKADTRDLVAAPDENDPVAAALATRYPGLRRLRLTSSAPVTSSEKGRRFLELRVDGNTVQEALPNPSIRSFARLDAGDPGGPIDTWYQVIEHLSTPGAMGRL